MSIDEKKAELEELEKVAKAQKSFLLRADITVGIIALFTCALAGFKGYNPFISYLELFTFPTVMLVHANIMIMRKLNSKRKEILQEIERLAHEETDHLKINCEDEDGPGE